MGLDFPVLDAPFLALAATVIVAGVARGMSGFGSGMIIAPVAAAIYGPQVAVPMLAILETLPTIPVTIPAVPLVRWREVLPVTVGLALFRPAGVYVLANSDADTLRWFICAAILVCAAVLWTGWRYQGPRDLPTSLGVGGISGLLSGLASIPGPPVIFYWMASDLTAKAIRANLLAFFLLGDFLSIASFWMAGLFKPDVLGIGVAAMPFYFASLLVGSKLHGIASDAAYRRVTFLLIVLSAVLALPLVQPLFGLLGSATPTDLPGN
jgi:uncharacterized membrane protein YfcA